jgi:hypothetical protein
MTTIAKVISLAFPLSSADTEMLQIVAIFSSAGLLISLTLACCGLNLDAVAF